MSCGLKGVRSMIAVAGAVILLAMVAVFLFVGFVLMARDIGRFLWRHKGAAAIIALASGILAAVSVAGLYSQPYNPPHALR
jgi:hypothetical protein